MKLIKRYSNRKLYDTERSCYVTLDEIAVMVRNSEDVQIIDNKSGEDLTTVTLAQILYEEEKRDKKVLPLNALRAIIQQPSDFIARLSKPVTDIREESKRQVERFRRGAEMRQEELTAPVREWFESIQRSIEEMQTKLDDRMKGAADALTHVPDLAQDIVRLDARMERLERDVRKLSTQLERVLDRRDMESNGLPGGQDVLPR